MSLNASKNHRSEESGRISGFPELITSKDATNLSSIVFGASAEVVNFGLSAYSEEKIGFLGSHQRLSISARLPNDSCGVSSLSASFFVKALPYDVPTQADYVREKGVFLQEATFFGEVVPELASDFRGESWAPECHLIKNDCLVFEDLGQRGFSMSEKLLDEEEIKSGLGALSRLHASSLIAETRLRRPLNEIFPSAFEERAFVQRGNQRLWFLAGVDVVLKIAENLRLNSSKIPEACERVFRAMKPSRLKQNVANHGDLWSNNLMFDRSRPPRCRLVDFQLARYAPLGHDIAQFLHLCASKQFRDARTPDMLQFYFDSLGECLKKNTNISVKIPSWNEFLLGYEEQKLAAIVTAAIYFPTVLLDGQRGAEIMNDPLSYEQFVFHDRRDAVLDNMKRDQRYRRRLEETVRELVDYSLRLEELPDPS